jgi:hypothetical protein
MECSGGGSARATCSWSMSFMVTIPPSARVERLKIAMSLP